MKLNGSFLLLIGLFIGATANASIPTADNILSLKVAMHQVTADFFAYQANKENVEPSFEINFKSIRGLISAVGESDDVVADEFGGILEAWDNFHSSITLHIKSNNYTNAHAVSDMIQYKNDFIMLLSNYESIIESKPSLWKIEAYKQSLILTQIIETYSKFSASMYGLPEGDWLLLTSLCDEFDDNMVALEKRMSDVLVDNLILQKIKSKWNFIRPSIISHHQKKAVPFIIVRYGNDIVNKLMAIDA